jgi:SWI/SNF-related matrix-associated actin-dependent regulator of chromatin subfamily D
MDSSYRVKIEGRLLDEEEDELDSDDSEDEETNGDAMDEDGKESEKKTKNKIPVQQYKFSHFFKAMTVDYDRKGGSGKEGDQSVEWKKPVVTAGATSLPNAADFDQLEFKRGGDENTNITINLFRDENPERFQLSPALAEILDRNEATRAEALMGIWDYIRVMGLEEDEEKREFECDARLKAVCITSPTIWHHTNMARSSNEKRAIFPTSQTPSNTT